MTAAIAATVADAATVAAIVALATIRRPVLSRRSGTPHQRRWPSSPMSLWPSPNMGRRQATTLPDALDTMCRNLRAGQSVPSALSAAASECHGPIAEQWSELVATVSTGTDLGDAVRAWGARRSGARRSGTDEALAAAAISIGVAFGGPRADAIEAVAQTLRERASLRAQLQGFAAQARLSALVISLAPLVFTSITIASDDASRDVMLGSPAGRVCVVVGVTLDAIGWWWMGRIGASAAGAAS